MGKQKAEPIKLSKFNQLSEQVYAYAFRKQVKPIAAGAHVYLPGSLAGKEFIILCVPVEYEKPFKLWLANDTILKVYGDPIRYCSRCQKNLKPKGTCRHEQEERSKKNN